MGIGIGKVVLHEKNANEDRSRAGHHDGVAAPKQSSAQPMAHQPPAREHAGIVRRKIDELISTYAQGWDMDRLPAVDRNILRLGIYEILWCKDLADAVAIDEALNLAKELSTDDSATYIHGVLGRIASIKDSLAI